MNPDREMTRFSFVILVAFVWLTTSTTLTVRAQPMVSVKRLKLDLRGSRHAYFWTHRDQRIEGVDRITIPRDQALRLELVNHTQKDYVLNLHQYPFRYLSGINLKSKSSDEVYLTAGNRTVIEIPARVNRSWQFNANRLYGLRDMHDQAYLPDPSMPRAYTMPTSNPHIGIMQSPEGKDYERNPVSVIPGVKWYKDFLLYTNYFGVNSSMWSGRAGSDVMFEHDYDDQYRFQIDFIYNPFEDLDLYLGYERDKKQRRNTINHAHLGAHYTLPWFESDLTYDKDDHFVLRLRTEVPINEELRFFADYDTNHDGRFKFLYSVTRDLSLVANYHWRYHGGIGIDYTF